MRTQKVGAATVLAGIVQMVVQAQRSRAPMQRMADKADSFDSVAGSGVTGTVAGRALGLGNTVLMNRLKVSIDTLQTQAEALRTDGASVMILAVDGKAVGLLVVSDPIKASTSAPLATLKATGLHVIMATGDGLTTANAIAARLGIEEGYRPRTGDLGANDREHEAEPGVRLRLQRNRGAPGRRRSLSIHGLAAFADDRGRRDEHEFPIGHHQCLGAARNATRRHSAIDHTDKQRHIGNPPRTSSILRGH